MAVNTEALHAFLRGERDDLPCPDGQERNEDGDCVPVSVTAERVAQFTVPPSPEGPVSPELQRLRERGTRTLPRSEEAGFGVPDVPDLSPREARQKAARRLTPGSSELGVGTTQETGERHRETIGRIFERIIDPFTDPEDIPSIVDAGLGTGQLTPSPEEPTTDPRFPHARQLRPEFTEEGVTDVEKISSLGDAFLDSLGDFSLVGGVAEAVRGHVREVRRDLLNLAKRATGGDPITEEEFEGIDRRLESIKTLMPASTATAEFLGSATGIAVDIMASAGLARGIASRLPAGRAKSVAEAFGTFKHPTRTQSAMVEAAREAPIQAAVAMRDEFGLENALEGGVLAATFGAAFPGGRAGRRLALELMDEEISPSGGFRRFTFMLTDEAGDRAAPIAVTVDEGSKHLDVDIADLADRGTYGPREMRDVGRDIVRFMDEQGIQAETIGGFRTTGSRVGEAAAEGGAPAQRVISTERLRNNPEAGYLLLPNLDLDNMTRPLREFFGRELRVAGDLPEEAFESKFKNDSWVKAQSRRTVQTVREYTRVLDEVIAAGHFDSRQEAERVVNLALQAKGPAPTALLPKELRPIVGEMREQIDALSQRMIDEGVVAGDMIATFEENKGLYLNRAYLSHEDPSWVFETIDPGIVNRARNYIRNQPQYQNLNSDQIDELMRRLLFEEDFSPIQVARRTGVGSKDLSVMKRRILDSVEMRDLYGEIQTASANYIRSTMKMSSLIGSHRFLTETKAAGLAGGWLSPAGDFVSGHTARIAADASDTMFPLNGMHTTPAIRQALEDALHDPIVHSMPAWYMKAVGFTKYSKTVLSPMTHVRNFVSATAFQLANGHLFNPNIASNARISARVIAADVMGKGRGTANELSDIAQQITNGTLDLEDTGNLLAVANRLTELGVVGTSARSGEIRSVYRGTLKDEDPYGIIENFSTGPIQKTARAASNAYGAEDDFHKIMGFLSEYQQQRRARPNLSNSEVEELAARVIRDQYPTYPLTPRLSQRLSKNPVVAPFAIFTAETIRTGYNIMRRTASEIASSDPNIQAMGYRRAFGILGAGAGTGALAEGSRQLVGISDETDEEFREGLPPWSRNSEILWLGWDRDKATADYIDLSYTDPYNYFKKPVTALLSGQDWEQSFTESMRELTDPWIQPDIFTSAMFESAKIIQQGRESNTPIEDVVNEVSESIFDAASPGFISQGARIAKGFGWIKDEDNRDYSGPQELLATVTGLRVSKVNFHDMVRFRSRDLRIALSEAQASLRREVMAQIEKDPSEIEEKFYDIDDRRRDLIGEFNRVIRTARTAGLNDIQIEDLMRRGGLSKSLARDILDGYYIPYIPEDIPEGTPQEFEREIQLDDLQFDAEFNLDSESEPEPRGSGIGTRPDTTLSPEEIEEIHRVLRGGN